MKKIIPAYILTIVIWFTIIIYEPIVMYANNINDIWFDFRTMIIPIIFIFTLGAVITASMYTLIYILSKKIFKNNKIYNMVLIISFIIYFASYIQGNYLIKNLPRLDGEIIDWTGYTTDNIITLVVWIIMILTYIITIKKYKIEKVINMSKNISLVVFAMLFVSLLTTTMTHNTFIKKTAVEATSENINLASNEKNFFIFLVDAVDSRTFDKIRKEKYKDVLDDFTYYPNTTSVYAFTRDSIPQILSGEWNNNEKSFIQYYNDAMNNSSLMNELIEKNYNINLYENELQWSTDKVNNVRNVRKIKNKIKLYNFTANELKYVAFKYLPYKFKKYAKIENMNFEWCKKDRQAAFSWWNRNIYDTIKNSEIEKTNEKVFHFIHIEGGHVPLDMDENLNIIENGTYEQKLEATMKIIKTYLERLKKYNVYDNSTIIILADHGYSYETIEGRFNPILYIKGVNEHHKIETSDKPISYLDLTDAYKELLNGKKSNELFKNIKQERTRKIIWYEYSKENHMTEYEQKGKAWEFDKMVQTGKKYNR